MTYQPFRRAIAALLMGGICLLGIPNQAFADMPSNLPEFYYYHGDHLGSSSVITDRSGAVVRQYGYKPFGNERYNNDPVGGENVQRRYTGQILDEETGLYYYNARYYDAEIGRFIQADSVLQSTASQGLNRYTYCGNNPLVFTDPSGNIIELITAVAFEAIYSGIQAERAGGRFEQGMWRGAVSAAINTIGGNFGLLGRFGAAALSAQITGGDPGQAAISSLTSFGYCQVK